MADDFNVNAEIGINVTGEEQLIQLSKALSDAANKLATLGGAADAATAKSLGKIERSVAKASGELNKFSTALNKSEKSAGSAQYQKLKKDLDEINAAFQQFQQANIGTGRDFWTETGTSMQRVLDLNKALTQTAVGGAQERTRAEKAAAKEAQNVAYQTYSSNIAAGRSSANLRYALYDVANTYKMISLAAIGTTAAVEGVAIAYQKSFASVQRTTGATGSELAQLRTDLVDLTTQIPVSFGAITEIATLGGQLNIASEDIANFSNVVAMFSASTDTTVSSAAEGIGRLAQLTGTAGSEYENLASAIYQTGVTAVATESAILETAAQIATAGDLAGFANHEIVALASAFASLNIAPERARGTVQRVFNEITVAVDEGSSSLAQFANISGMSANQFASAWKETPQVAFSALIKGLQGLQQEGINTDAVISNLGIKAVRDKQALEALANNYEVYAEALNQTSSAYASGTALGEGYAIIQETVAASLQRLLGTLTAIADSIGGANLGPLNSLIGALQKLAEIGLAIARNPVGQAVGQLVLVAALAVGGMAALRGALARANASMLALRYSTEQAGAQMGSLGAQARQLVGSLTAIATGSTSAATGVKTLSVAASSLGKTTLIGAGITAGLWAVNEAVSVLSKAFESNSDRAARYFSDLSGLSDAIQKDTKTWKETGQALRVIDVNTESSSASLNSWGQAIQNASSDQLTLSGATSQTTEEIKKQQVAIGDATTQQLAQQISEMDDLRLAWDENGAAIKAAGFNLDTYIRALASGTSQEYVTNLINQFYALRDSQSVAVYQQELLTGAYAGTATAQQEAEAARVRFDAETGKTISTLTTFRDVAQSSDAAISETVSKINFGTEVMQVFGDTTDDTSDAVSALETALKSAFEDISSIADVQAALADLGKSLFTNGADFSAYSEQGRANLSALEQAVTELANSAGNDTAVFTGSLADLLASLEGMGIDVTGQLGSLQDVLVNTFNQTYGLDLDITAAQNGIQTFIASAIAALEARAALERANAKPVSEVFKIPGQQGNLSPFGNQPQPKVTVNKTIYDDQIAELQKLQTELANAGGTGTEAGKAIQQGFNAATEKANKTAKAAGKASEKIRTLADYARDLKAAFDEDFEIRFGVSNAEDVVANQFEKMLNNAKETAYNLQAVFDKAFARQQGVDAITSQYYSMIDAAEAARKAIRDATQEYIDAQAKMQALSADRTVLQYQLKVAYEYQDALRATQIEAELAKNTADLAKASNDAADARKKLAEANSEINTTLVGSSKQAIKNRSDIINLATSYQKYIQALIDGGASNDEIANAIANSKNDFLAQAQALGFSREELQQYAAVFNSLIPAQDGSSKSLEGNSQAARDNRAEVQALLKAYQDQITALARSGLSTDDLKARTEQLKQQFIQQLTQLGYNRTEAEKYAKTFDDLTAAIARVPRDIGIKVSADTSSAQNSLNNFKNANQGINIPISTSFNDAQLQKAARGAALQVQLADLMSDYNRQMAEGNWQSARYTGQAINDIRLRLTSGNYWAGGFTGRGDKYEDAGRVHRGEYVLPKELVNQNTGLPYADALRRIGVPQSNSIVNNTNNYGPNDMVIVELSTYDRQLIRSIGDVAISIGPSALANAVSSVAVNGARRGQ